MLNLKKIIGSVFDSGVGSYVVDKFSSKTRAYIIATALAIGTGVVDEYNEYRKPVSISNIEFVKRDVLNYLFANDIKAGYIVHNYDNKIGIIPISKLQIKKQTTLEDLIK